MTGVPAYRRIFDDLEARIRSGALKPDEQLPPEAMLAEQYGVSRMTVRQAVGKLVAELLVTRQQGVGTFVLQVPTNRRSLNRLTGFSEDMGADEVRLETELIQQEVIAPPRRVLEALKLSKNARVVRLLRLRRTRGRPLALQCSDVPFGLFPALAREPLIGNSLYRTLEERFDTKLRRAEQRISAIAIPADMAALLGVEPLSPALLTERVTMDDRNVPVEYAQSWALPGTELTVHLER